MVNKDFIVESGHKLIEDRDLSIPSTNDEAELVWRTAIAEFSKSFLRATTLLGALSDSEWPSQLVTLSRALRKYDLQKQIGLHEDMSANDLDHELKNIYIREIALVRDAEDVACVTIAHGGFEMFLTDLIRVLAFCKRRAVAERIEGKSFQLKTIQTSSVEEIIDAGILQWVREQFKKPLLSNWKTLMSLAPPQGELRGLHLPYDEDWIEKLDINRQRVVHRGGVGFDRSLTKGLEIGRLDSMATALWVQVGISCGFVSERMDDLEDMDFPDALARKRGEIIVAVSHAIRSAAHGKHLEARKILAQAGIVLDSENGAGARGQAASSNREGKAPAGG